MTVHPFNAHTIDDAHTLYAEVAATPLRPSTLTALERRYMLPADHAFAKFTLQWMQALPDRNLGAIKNPDGAGFTPNGHALHLLGAYNIGGPKPHTVGKDQLLAKLREVDNIATIANLLEHRPQQAASGMSRS